MFQKIAWCHVNVTTEYLLGNLSELAAFGELISNGDNNRLLYVLVSYHYYSFLCSTSSFPLQAIQEIIM